jgi:hypothetical protein
VRGVVRCLAPRRRSSSFLSPRLLSRLLCICTEEQLKSTLKSSCASANNVGLIDDSVELATEVRCDDHKHGDLIGMLTEPTHCGLWITWRGLQCEAAIGLVHPEETTLQTVPIHEDCVVVEVLTVYTIFADELLEYPPNV